jgi:site-specific recombinase XerD
MLYNLPKNNNMVFPNRSKNARRSSFRHRMQTLSRKHNNPRFLKIHLHTFRHCKALNEYNKTKDILHVKAVLGHRSINTTMRYVGLYSEIFGKLESQNFISKVASTKEDRQKLLESGFEWVGQDNEGLTYFRKLKQTDVL